MEGGLPWRWVVMVMVATDTGRQRRWVVMEEAGFRGGGLSWNGLSWTRAVKDAVATDRKSVV